MKSDPWAEVLVIVAIAAPLAGIVVTRAIAHRNDRRWFVVGSGVGAAAWLVLLVAGQQPTVGRLGADDFALAAGAGTCLLAIGLAATTNLPVLAAAVSAVTAGIAAGSSTGPSTIAPLLGVAVAAALVASRPGRHLVRAAVVGAGVVVAGVGLHTGDHRGAVLVLVGAAAIAVVGALSPRDAWVIVVPAALVLGLRVAPALDGASISRWCAVGFAAAAVGLAVLRRPWWCAALVPWTFAAAVGALPGTAGAGPALAAGAVLALALGGQMAVVAAVPGAALLTYALVEGDGWVRPALAMLLVATVVAMSAVQPPPDGEVRWRWLDAVPTVLAAWLVLRPTSWTFLHVDDLSAYVQGTAFVIAAGLLGGVAAFVSGRFTVVELAPWFARSGTDPAETDAIAPRVEIAPILVIVLTGILAAALVRSSSL